MLPYGMTDSAITIRSLGPEDWAAFRAIRLRALSLHPDVFLASHAKTKAMPESEWRSLLNGQGKWVLALFDGKKIIGINAVITKGASEEGNAGFHMSFIEPDYRGRELFHRLNQACIEWARAQGLRFVYVGVRDGNTPSERAFLRCGFKQVDAQETNWPDGTTSLENIYRLEL